MVAKKDFNTPKHQDIEGVPNLQVIKAAQVSNESFSTLCCTCSLKLLLLDLVITDFYQPNLPYLLEYKALQRLLDFLRLKCCA